MNLPSLRPLLRIAYLSLIGAAIMVTLLIVVLSSIDLNDYRQSLEQQLSTALRQPVSIGDGSFSYSQGLVIQFSDLRIGSAEAPLATVEKIATTLQLLPLLNRQIRFSRASITRPQINLDLANSKTFQTTPTGELAKTLGVERLTIHDGRLKIVFASEEGVRTLEITQLEAVLSNWQPGQRGQLNAFGQLPDYQAALSCTGQLPSSWDPQVWRHEAQRLTLQINHFKTADLPLSVLPGEIRTLDLDLQIAGIPAQGSAFKATISSQETLLFDLAGRWEATARQQILKGVTGQLLGLPINGQFRMDHKPDSMSLSGQLRVADQELSPDRLRPWGIPGADVLLGGHLNELQLQIEQSWGKPKPDHFPPVVRAMIDLTELRWDHPALEPLSAVQGEFSWQPGELRINAGQRGAAEPGIALSGTIQQPLGAATLDLQLNSTVQLKNWRDLLKLPTDFQLEGVVPLQAKLTGPLANLTYQLNSDLKQLTLRFNPLLNIQAGPQDQLFLQGTVDNTQITVESLSGQLFQQQLVGSGQFSWAGAVPRYRLQLEQLDIQALEQYIPRLRQLHPQGRIDLELSNESKGFRGRLNLDQVEADLQGIVGNLNQARGQIDFDTAGLSFEQLEARLGDSEVVLDGLLSDWSAPQLTLEVSGETIRAQDLIFKNRQMKLHDLQARLRINAEGVRFDPAQVRLEEDTLATVTGTVSNFSQPRIDLVINSEQADILDVIRVFSGKKKNAEKHKPESDRTEPIRITAQVARGRLGHLNFTNAQGMITVHNQILTIAPLTFANGAGYCRARITFDPGKTAAALQISGHAERIDATVLHQDFFTTPGLIQGELDGDFFIQGNPTKGSFWSSARGGLHLQVRDGTLRKFHGLAKVFSLLNVSQLFKAKLPDMSTEGMPFNLMDGSFRIAEGWLRTDDLKIDSESMNLSLVGSKSLVDQRLDATLGVMPLRTVDKVITSIPLAGWILTGENEALVTAQFRISGTADDPQVTPIPISSLSDTVLGIFKRTLGLPGKVAEGIGGLFDNKSPEGQKNQDKPDGGTRQ